MENPFNCKISEPKLPVMSKPIPNAPFLIPLKKVKADEERAVKLV